MTSVLEAPKAKKTRSARMDLRCAEKQRESYERAASLKGMSLTEWILSHLDECAEDDIIEATSSEVSPGAFDKLVAALEEPMPNEMRELLVRETAWA